MSSSIGVVGAGLVGLATARALAETGARVTVLDKERAVATHQSGRNSGVVHAGLYYQPGSLKARLCRQGVGLLRDYCQAHDIAYEAVGKVVVAATADEVPGLEDIGARATANGVPGLRRLGPRELAEREPSVRGVAALLSPETAITDYPAVARRLAEDVRDLGGEVHLGAEVVGIRRAGREVVVATREDELAFRHLVVCGGLQSDHLARLAGGPREPAIVPFRGEYYELVPGREHLVRGLVYPVPDPGYPFLGVHFTRRVHGGVDVGPNAVPALAREGYRWRDLDRRELWETLTWPGTRALARQHWRMGLDEITASFLKRRYVEKARRFVPELRASDLVRAPAGVRAQALRADGTLEDDFAIDFLERVTVVRNAPSPAATSSLAIGRHLAELLGGELG